MVDPTISGMSETAETSATGDQVDSAHDPLLPHQQRLDKRVLMTAGVVVLGAIMSILDITIVSVGLNTFQDVFKASPAQVAWTMTGYTLALAAVIPLTGWASDRFGTKRLYLLAVVLFTMGSALCATASTLELLVTYRVLQGLGGGMLMPLGMTILTRAAGPERVGRVMAVLGVPMLLGPIFGPILGGWMIDNASWHWMFLINVPIGILAVVYAWLVLPKDHVEPTESFDFIGMLLLSPGLALFLYGVSSIPSAAQNAAQAIAQHRSTAPHFLGVYWESSVLYGTLIGVVLIVAFTFWALRRSNIHPLVDLRLFRERNLTIAVIAMALFAIAFFGGGLLFPLYFQQVRDLKPFNSGLLLAPQGLGAMVTMPIAGVLADKIGPGKVVLTGLVLDTIGMGLFSTVNTNTSQWHIIFALIIMGLGMGATMMPMFSAALATLTDHSVARGSTLLNITQQVAASIGTALFSVLLTRGFNNGHHVAFGLAESAAQGDEKKLPGIAAQLKLPLDQFLSLAHLGKVEMVDTYAWVFLVATVLVGCCLIPAFFLPRKPPEHAIDPAAMMGH